MATDQNDADQKPGHRSLRRGRVSLPYAVYLVTATTIDRARFFANFAAGCAAARCFTYRSLLGDATMLAWVLMPDHVHWLLQLGALDRLSPVINRLKSASAREANQALGRRGALWRRAYHDHALRADENLATTARYLAGNPVRAGLVTRAGDYPFWDTIWL